MLYCVAYFMFSFTIQNVQLMHFFTFTLVHMQSSNALTPQCASFLHACRSKYLVCICRKLTKHMYFVACLVFGSHLHLSSFNKNTYIHMKIECKTVSSLCKGEGTYICFCKKKFKQKVVVFLTFVTIYLIWNPKPDKDNTCTTIHYHEGDTPLRTACRPISASRTAYRLTTKQPFLAISFT